MSRGTEHLGAISNLAAETKLLLNILWSEIKGRKMSINKKNISKYKCFAIAMIVVIIIIIILQTNIIDQHQHCYFIVYAKEKTLK